MRPAQIEPRRALAPLALLLALLCAAYLVTLGDGGMFMWDEAEYATLGRSLARGDGYSVNGRPNVLRPPGLPLSVAASLKISGSESDAAARAPMILWALAALAIAAWGARRSWAPRTGMAAAALLGTTPIFWQHTAFLLTEVPYMACFTAAVWHLHLALAGQRRAWIYCGLWLGLAFYFRYTAVLFAPILVVFVLPRLARERMAFVRRTFFAREPWLGALVVVGVQAPWLLRQALLGGDPLAGFRATVAVFPAWAAMPWYFYLRELPAALSWPIAALATGGAALAVWRRDTAALHCLAAAGVVLAWLSAYPYKDMRLVSSAAPFVCTLAAYAVTHGIATVIAQRRGDRAAGWASAGVVVAAAGVAAWMSLGVVRHTRTLGYPVFTAAMERLRRAAPGPVLGANLPQLAWYADRAVLPFPRERAELPPVLERATWVVIVNFERGQPPYVRDLAALVRDAASRPHVLRVTGGPYEALVVRASHLRARLAR